MLPSELKEYRATGRLRKPVAATVVVTAGSIPSFEYYLRGRLDDLPDAKIAYLHDDPRTIDAAGTFILFCRYVTGTWLDYVERNGDKLAGVGLFVDDDIGALVEDWRIPPLYRWRLLRRNVLHRARLNAQLDFVYVANSRLAERHRIADPIVLEPAPPSVGSLPHRCGSEAVRIAVHSTAAHWREQGWLRGVMRNVLTREKNASVEAIATPPQAWLWRSLPRTVTRLPMTFDEYRAHAMQHGADILVAPLIPSPANSMRSLTKRIDAARLGAALIVSDADIYEVTEEEHALGMCVPLHKPRWAEALAALVRDRPRRQRLRDLNAQFVAALRSRSATPFFQMRADSAAQPGGGENEP